MKYPRFVASLLALGILGFATPLLGTPLNKLQIVDEKVTPPKVEAAQPNHYYGYYRGYYGYYRGYYGYYRGYYGYYRGYYGYYRGYYGW